MLLTSQGREPPANPGRFKALRSQHADLPVTPEIARLVAKPLVGRALDRAKSTGLIAEPPDVANLSFAHLLDVRKAIRSGRERAFREGDGTLVTALRDTQAALEREMERMVPGWREVNDGYAARSRVIDRVVEGTKQWTQEDSRELAELVHRLPPEELQALRTGLASRLVSRLRSVQTNRDEAKRIIGAGPAMQEKLRAVFGTEERFREFMGRAQLEADMSRSRSAVGGSATHRRGMAGTDVALDLGVGVATGGLSGAAAQVPGMVARMMPAAVRRRTAAQLAPWLMTQGSREVDELLRGFSQRPARVGETSVRRLPAALGTLFDDF